MSNKHYTHKKHFHYHKIYRKKRNIQSLSVIAPLMITVLFVLALSLATSASEKRGLLQPLNEVHNAAPAATPAIASSTESVMEKLEPAPITPSTDLTSLSLFVTVRDGSRTSTGMIAVKDHPEWIHTEKGMWSEKTSIDPKAVEQTIASNGIAGIPLVQNSEILSIETDKNKVLRPVTSRLAKAGFSLNATEVSTAITNALLKNESTLTINAPYVQPIVTMTAEDGTVKTLTLLTTGYSDFAGSAPGRTHNVYKAIEERIKSILVKKGETFSLIPALDAPITVAKGWEEDLGLFGGGAALTPGAGICQSATTLYRAALLAGLPIVERRNHSLDVDHYEPYGRGLDATVFPFDIAGKNTAVNLRFKNDTPDDLYIQSYIEGNTVLVQLFGIDDGRKSLLEGPYFSISKNRPKGEIRALNNREIGWVQTITRADGTSTKKPIISTYAKPIWHSQMLKYVDAKGMELMVPDNY